MSDASPHLNVRVKVQKGPPSRIQAVAPVNVAGINAAVKRKRNQNFGRQEMK